MHSKLILTSLSILSTILSCNAHTLPPSIPRLSGRDVALVNNTLWTVSTYIKRVAFYVEAFTSTSSSDEYHVTEYTKDLVNQIRTATEQVRDQADDVSLHETYSLRAVVSEVHSQTTNLGSYLKAQKAEFERAEMCGDVLEYMAEVKNEAERLVNEIRNRMATDEGRDIIDMWAETVGETLEEAEELYAEGNCVDGAPEDRT